MLDAIGLDERLPRLEAHRLEERARHRAADDQRVDLRQQRSMTSILPEIFAPPRIGDERPLRILERAAEVVELLLHQETGDGRRADSCATPSVDACARCADPNASFT